MDIQFTTKAQDALGAAVRIAAANGNPQVEPLHLLDSLLQQGEGVATALLEAVGVDVRTLTAQVRQALSSLPSAQGSSVAPARDAFRSGVRTVTPWRRASCTSECGE